MTKIIPINNRFLANVLWLCFCLFLLVFSLGLSWQVNKSNNFFYSFWYAQLNIEQMVRTYVPQNTQGKQDFAKTTSKQHLQSFAEIVAEIHNGGTGLTQLSYLNNKQQVRALLTPAEVIHLKDVGNLVDQLHTISVINFLLLLGATGIIYLKKLPRPSRKDQQIAIVVPSLLLITSFSIFGFTNIFYYLHTVVFPDNHQWFFYYQESLMSSLMKAPDLFAAIGFMLSFFALIIYIACYQLLATKIFKA